MRSQTRGDGRALLIALLFIFASMLAHNSHANAQALQAGQIWQGTYECAQGTTNFKLEVNFAQKAGVSFWGNALLDVSAVFVFNKGDLNGAFEMKGQYQPLTKSLELNPSQWIQRPPGYRMVGMKGNIGADGVTLTGRITQLSGCRDFSLTLTNKEEAERKAQVRAPKFESNGDTVITFRKNKCRALAAWVKPLRSEFPGADYNGYEQTVMDKYKFLFVDEHFAPIFGKPFDQLGNSALNSISQAITRKGKKCKSYDSPDDIYLREHSYVWITRPFNRKLHDSGLSYGFVTRHLLARRAMLEPVQLAAGEKLNAAQLAEVVKPGEPIFDLLWPSERLALTQLTTTSTAQSADGQSANQPAGRWLGLSRCRRSIQSVDLEVKRLPGRLAAMLNGQARTEFDLLPQGAGRFQIQRNSQTLDEHLFIQDSSQFGEVLRAPRLAGCSDYWAVRFHPLPNVGGHYAKAKNQPAFCRDVVGGWLRAGAALREIAKRLQEDQFPLGSNFDPMRSAAAGLFKPDVLEAYFGSASTLTDSTRQALGQQVASCVVALGDKGLPDTWRLLFDSQAVRAAQAAVTSSASSTKIPPLKMTARYEAFVAGDRDSVAGSASDVVAGWRSVYDSNRSAQTLTRLLNGYAGGLSDYPPAEVEQAIAPLVAASSTARATEQRVATAAQRERYRGLLEGVSIPYSRIEQPYRRLLEAMADGRQVELDSGTMLFLAGLSGHNLKNCSTGLSTSERMPIAEFVGQSVLRAGMGDNYSDTNIGRNMQSSATGQAIFAAGSSAAQVAGCDAADPLLRIVGDVLRANSSGEQGQEPVFVRSCTPVHGEASCRCAAKVGMAVYPDIYHKRYHRNIIATIIQKNPMVGMQIAFQCGISNY